MSQLIEAPVTAARPGVDPLAGAPELATILLLAGEGALADQLVRLCSALGLRLLFVHGVASLAEALHGSQPIGFACGMAGTGATAACHATKIVARYDMNLPVLMVTDDDPETLGCLDAIATLAGVTDLTRLSEPPRIDDVLAFVARAGRRSGRLALMPV
jgi:hypothetical protein